MHYTPTTTHPPPVVSEAYHDWSSEAAGTRLRVSFTLKLLLSQNFCNWPLMRFISFASNIGPAAVVPAGPAPAPLTTTHPTAFHNPSLHTTNKHKAYLCNWQQNGTRCRDGVKVLWCHSHLVWFVFEASIPTCTCFVLQKSFCDL